MDSIVDAVVNHPMVQYATKTQMTNGIWGSQRLITDYFDVYIAEYTISFAYVPYILRFFYFVSLFLILITFSVMYQLWGCMYYAAAGGNAKNTTWCLINANDL